MVWVPKRFQNGNLGNTGNSTLYTAPAGKRAIVTDWNVSVNATLSMSLYLAGFTTGNGGQFAANRTFTEATTTRFQGFYVLEAGDALVATPSALPGNAWQHVVGVEGDASDLYTGGTPFRALHTATHNGDTVMYTVPAGKTAVIKTMFATNVNNVAPGTAAIRIGAAPVYPFYGPLGAVNGPDACQQLDGTWIATAGETVTVNGQTTGITAFYLSGVLF